MIQTRTQSRRGGILAVTALLLLFGARALPAQRMTAASDDSVARVLLLSTPEDLRRRAGQAAANAQAARQLLDQARQEVVRVQALIDIQRLEFKAIEKRLDLAKKEKRESDRKTLEEERNAREVRLKMFERWHDVHEVTIRTAELAREVAREYRKAADAELQLLDLRSTAAGSAQADSAVRVFEIGQLDENLIRQTRRVLEARRAEADLRRQLAERERELAEKQLALLEAQLAARSVRN
jgi:hypothetical protein